MPYFHTEDQPESDFLRVLDSKRTSTRGFLGNGSALKSVAEGGSWETTISVSRLTGRIANVDAEDKGYVFGDKAVDMLDDGEELREMPEHLRGDYSGIRWFSNGVAQYDGGRLGEALNHVSVEDIATREENSIG